LSDDRLYEEIGRLYINSLMKEQPPDYTDMAKYQKYGAYHHSWYNKNANNYREQVNEIIDFIINYIEKGDNIVEIGCGDGLYVKLLSQKGYKVSGIDVNVLAVKLAYAKKVENISICDASVYNKNHDVCLLIDSFEHFTEPIKVIRNLNKLIGKRIILLNPNWRNDKHHFAFYSKQDLETIFAQCWKITDIKTISHKDKTKDLIVFERKLSA
jgi:2-polyprenyl-3-methyl-5-hydroxy-6-metoxy-1,4-benzoquinol methylase